LIEVAPGIDIERDILPKMDFVPQIDRSALRVMDPRIFQSKLMDLRHEMIQKFLDERIDYDAVDNVMFIDLAVRISFLGIF
jgi:propionate CoA-transferase